MRKQREEVGRECQEFIRGKKKRKNMKGIKEMKKRNKKPGGKMEERKKLKKGEEMRKSGQRWFIIYSLA